MVSFLSLVWNWLHFQLLSHWEIYWLGKDGLYWLSYWDFFRCHHQHQFNAHPNFTSGFRAENAKISQKQCPVANVELERQRKPPPCRLPLNPLANTDLLRQSTACRLLLSLQKMGAILLPSIHRCCWKPVLKTSNFQINYHWAHAWVH